MRGEPLKLADGRALMTLIALQSGVCTEKGKAILVILYLLDGRVPSADGVALRTVGAKFPTVNISVAVRAGFANISEDGLDVALRTANFFVHAAQRIRGFIVVELHVAADRPPAVRGMAIFARDGERAVRAARALSLPVSGQYEEGQWDNQPKPMMNSPNRKILPRPSIESRRG